MEIDLDGVREFVERYTKEVRLFEEQVRRFSETEKDLESWVNPVKDGLVAKIHQTLPDFEHLNNEVLPSYSKVAYRAQDSIRKLDEKYTKILNG